MKIKLITQDDNGPLREETFWHVMEEPGYHDDLEAIEIRQVVSGKEVQHWIPKRRIYRMEVHL